jgi:hypothetical protein
MNTNKKSTPYLPGSRGSENIVCNSSLDPKLCVTVIATTETGTIAALNEASRLAQDLDAHITLLKIEVVPSSIPLDKPLLLGATTKRQCLLLSHSSASKEDVTIRVCHCRDFDLALQPLLRRRALVIIGGRRHWWVSKAEKLEKALRRLGHHVIFVDARRSPEHTFNRAIPAVFQRDAGAFHTRSKLSGSLCEHEELR